MDYSAPDRLAIARLSAFSSINGNSAMPVQRFIKFFRLFHHELSKISLSRTFIVEENRLPFV